MRFVTFAGRRSRTIGRASGGSLPTGVPDPNGPWTDIEEFALSCAPDGGHAELTGMASRARQLWNRYGQLPEAMADLQACLFFEQRRWHLFGAEPDDRARAYVSALVLAIGSTISSTTDSTTGSATGSATDGERAEAG